MLISNKFNGYVAGRRTYHTGMEPILLGAAIGGGTSALRGGNPLQGALLGGLTGGVGSAVSGALPSLLGSAAQAAPISAAIPSSTAAGATAATEAAASGLGGAVASPINMGSSLTTSQLSPLAQGMGGLGQLAPEAGGLGDMFSFAPEVSQASAMNPAAAQVATQAAAPQAASNLSFLGGQEAAGYNIPNRFTGGQQVPRGLLDVWKNLSPEKKLLYGGGGMLGLMALTGGQRGKMPGQAPYTGPLSRFSYDPSVYRPRFAKGGIADLGSYSDGGRLLKGPGDGMSDNIPAVIAQKQPARLADGEFVVPADVVSHLGNGSTDAGAKHLYAMMERVRAARTGNSKQGKEIDAEKFLGMPKKRKVKRLNGGGDGGDGGGGGDGPAADASAAADAAAAAAQDGQGPAGLNAASVSDGQGPAGIDAASESDGIGEAVNAQAMADAGLAGLASMNGGFYGANDFSGQYGGQGAAAAAKPEAKPQYNPMADSDVNTNIYRPSYTNYARSPLQPVSDYGRDMQSPFGEFMNPFAQRSTQGIAALYNHPEYADYGLAGLNR